MGSTNFPSSIFEQDLDTNAHLLGPIGNMFLLMGLSFAPVLRLPPPGEYGGSLVVLSKFIIWIPNLTCG